MHPVRAGEERRIGAKHRDEPAEEHDLGAVAHEDVPTHLELRLVEADVLAESAEQRIPAEPADAEPDVVADDRADDGRDDDAGDRQLCVAAAKTAAVMSIVSPGSGMPEALDADEQRDRQVADAWSASRRDRR